MRSGSVGPDKLGLALVLIKKRPERRSLIFLKFNGVKDVSSTIVSFKKNRRHIIYPTRRRVIWKSKNLASSVVEKRGYLFFYQKT